MFDAIDASDAKTGWANTGNQESSSFKTLVGGSGITNYDLTIVFRVGTNMYVCIATAASVSSTTAKIKILARGNNDPGDPNRFTKTGWFTIS